LSPGGVDVVQTIGEDNHAGDILAGETILDQDLDVGDDGLGFPDTGVQVTQAVDRGGSARSHGFEAFDKPAQGLPHLG
jgi:hypothetical protein